MRRALRIGVASLLAAPVGYVWGASWDGMPIDDATRLADVQRRLAFLERAIRDDAALERAQSLFPEGAAFVVALTGLAWGNVGRAAPAGSPARAEAAQHLHAALALYATPVVTRPFVDTQVRRGVFWLGQRNLLLAEWAELTPPEARDAALVAEFHANSDALAEAFAASPTAHLDAYPGQSWPVDNVTALTSLVLHDRTFGTRHAAAYERWHAWTRAHLDPATGLIAGRVDAASGALLEPGRGSTTGWMLPLLVRIDPVFAREQAGAAREHLALQRLGFRMAREWPAADAREADIDSGPIVWDAGMTATAAALGSARALGDRATADDIVALAAMFGVPWSATRDGVTETHVLGGELPVADAFLAYGLSVPWPATEDASHAARPGRVLGRWPFHLLAFAWTALLAAWALRRTARGPPVGGSAAPPPLRRANARQP